MMVDEAISGDVIPASAPTVIPAIPEKVLDKWVIRHLSFQGDGIRRPMVGMASFIKGHKAEDGTWTLDDNIAANLHVPDVWAKAAQDPEVANAIAVLTAVVTKLGIQAGVL
jgi:hypothetical protein